MGAGKREWDGRSKQGDGGEKRREKGAKGRRTRNKVEEGETLKNKRKKRRRKKCGVGGGQDMLFFEAFFGCIPVSQRNHFRSLKVEQVMKGKDINVVSGESDEQGQGLPTHMTLGVPPPDVERTIQFSRSAQARRQRKKTPYQAVARRQVPVENVFGKEEVHSIGNVACKSAHKVGRDDTLY